MIKMFLTDSEKYKKIIKQLNGKDKREYQKLRRKQEKAQKLREKYEKLYTFYENQASIELWNKMRRIERKNNLDFFKIK